MPLPHLKKENNAEPEEFISVEQEMNKIHRETHPFTPAHEAPNAEPANDDEKPSAD